MSYNLTKMGPLSLPLTTPPITNPISNILHRIMEKMPTVSHHMPTPQLEISDEFYNLPRDIQYTTGYATGLVSTLLLLQNRKPSKLFVGLDEDLKEPKITLIFDRQLSPKEEIKILQTISHALLYLAEQENNDNFLDIHFVIRDSQLRGSL